MRGDCCIVCTGKINIRASNLVLLVFFILYVPEIMPGVRIGILNTNPSCPSLAGDRQSLEVEYGRQKEFCPTDKIEESGVNRSSMK